jgi:hypothetical protein
MKENRDTEQGAPSNADLVNASAPPCIPAGIRTLLGKPPLVVGEDRDLYETLLAGIVARAQPKDIIAWMLVVNFANLQWENRRWHEAMAGIINVARRDGLQSMIELTIDENDIQDGSDPEREAEIRSPNWYREPDSRQATTEHLAKYDIVDVSDTMSAQAIAMRAPEIEMLQRMMAANELRCSAVLRELERHDEAMARRVRESREVIDVEAEEFAAIPSAQP